MKDVLIPVGGLLFIGLTVFAMVHAGRKQRKAKRDAFRDLAARNGFSYQEQDDGKAQAFAGDFDALGRFSSSSGGKQIPQDVVSGDIAASQAILFRHAIRWGEGDAMEWFVAGLIATKPIAERCSVQFCKRRWDKASRYLPDGIVKELEIRSLTLVVRAKTLSAAGRMADEEVLRQVGGFAEALSFRPEIQVRGNRMAAYFADRNTSKDAATLGELFEFSKRAERACA